MLNIVKHFGKRHDLFRYNNGDFLKLERSIKVATTTFQNLNSTNKQHQNISIVNDDNKETRNFKKLDSKFENSAIAFKSKSNSQLWRGLIVFKLCSVKYIVDNQMKLMLLAKKILGNTLFVKLMRSTFYGHFLGGTNETEMKPIIEKMRQFGVTAMITYSVEEDLSNENVPLKQQTDSSSSPETRYYHPVEVKCDKNTEIQLKCIDVAADVTIPHGITAIKVTAFIRPKILLKLSDLAFDTLRSDHSIPKGNIFQYVQNNYKTLDLTEWKKLIEKETKFGKIFSSNKPENLTLDELGEFRNMLIRLDKIAKKGAERNVDVFIDAEQTYFQWAITELAMELMREYNKSKVVILNTYQNYLKSTHDTLKSHIEQSKLEKFKFGAKLVRGAYMEQERLRAKDMGYEDPIQATFDATSKNYETNLLVCLNEIKRSEKGGFRILIASHNEDTVRYAVKKINELGVDLGSLYFGQLYGMCDYITYSLGAAGFPVLKYVPYGPVDEVLPYLSRRAQENRGIFDKVKKDKRLLGKELIDRYKAGKFVYNL